MIELRVLTGRQAGVVLAPSSFPWRIGRGTESDLRLDDPGVWDRHLEVELRAGEGAFARLQPPALATLNGSPFTESLLRNGDRLDLAGVALQFWLRPAPQRAFAVREFLTWAALVAFCLAQAGVILWLVR